MFDINYEDEISIELIKQFSYMYSIHNEEILYRYIYLRFLCENIDKSMEWLKNEKISSFEKENAYIDFFIKELNLPVQNNKIRYKEVDTSLLGDMSNCLKNVIEGWEFASSLHPVTDLEGNTYSFEKYIEIQLGKIINYAKNRAKKYKTDIYYDYYLKHFAFKYLNKIYGVDKDKIKVASKIEGFNYNNSYENYNLPMEYQCERYIHASRFETNNVEVISEKDLEDFLVRNIEVIEGGLKYIERQVLIENGRLDVLAKDKEGTYVIIELKVVEDKELVWQSLYYPYQYMKEHNLNKVRFITICPDYPEYMRIPLSKSNITEMMKYEAVIKNGKLVGLKLNRLN